MARSAKTTADQRLSEPLGSVHGKRQQVASASIPAGMSKGRAKQSVPAKAAPKVISQGIKIGAVQPAATPARVPPPTKGEMRLQIGRLEKANAALKAKSRAANRAVKLAGRRIIELEEQVAQLQEKSALAAKPVAPVEERQTARRGRPPGRKKALDTGEAGSPGVAVEQSKPLDTEVEAANDAGDGNLPGE